MNIDIDKLTRFIDDITIIPVLKERYTEIKPFIHITDTDDIRFAIVQAFHSEESILPVKGVINARGEEIVPVRYPYLEYKQCGIIKAMCGKHQPFYLYDIYGKLLGRGIEEKTFYGSLMLVRYNDSYRLYGPHACDMLHSFSHIKLLNAFDDIRRTCIYEVTKNDLKSVVAFSTENGEIIHTEILPYKYSFIESHGDDIYCVKEDGKMGYVQITCFNGNVECNDFGSVIFDEICERWADVNVVRISNKWGLLRHLNEYNEYVFKVVAPVVYDALTMLDNGNCKATKDGKCGIVSPIDGSIIVDLKYDDVSLASEGTYIVKKAGRFSFDNIDKIP